LAKLEARENRDPYRAWVDGGQLKHVPLWVRTRRPGDRVQPLGLGGRSQKLSDFMINVKMPQRARASWPLVTAGDKLVWVPGYRLAHPYRLTDETATAVYLFLDKSGGEKG
jgi:tRNA(Ile)-lysidine synthase